MTPFSYARASDAQEAIKMASTGTLSKYLGGGTNLVDLMRETVERPDALVDVTGCVGRRDRIIKHDRGDRRWRPPDRRRSAQHRTGRASRSSHALPGAGARDPRGSIGADQEHGDRRGKSAPAHALRLFLRH